MRDFANGFKCVQCQNGFHGRILYYTMVKQYIDFARVRSKYGEGLLPTGLLNLVIRFINHIAVT